MLKWERVHWLELLSIMAASMCKDLPSSINFICELLTEDSGSNAIPLWMFNTCYSFLAAFDCNSKAGSTNRDKHSLEPAQINVQTFRHQLITQWKECVKFSESPENSSISVHFDRIKGAVDFDEMIRVLREIQIDTQNNENEDDQMIKDSDTKWKYDIIRRIGAPWNWIYQFVDHYLPFTRSYNFYACQHKLFVTDSLEHLQIPNLTAFDMSGVGAVIPSEITTEFLNYIKSNALDNDGMVSSEYFQRENCPRMC